MADEHPPLAQAGVDLLSAPLGMASEEEVGARGQHGKAQLFQRAGEAGALGDDARRRFGVVSGVGDGGGAHRLTDAVDGIGIEAVAAALQPLDQPAAADGVAAADARQRIALGKGFDDEQIFIHFGQRHGALPEEGHVRLVKDDHAPRVGGDEGLDLREGDADARGCVGVGDEQPLRLCRGEFGKVLREVLFQRHDGVRDTEKAAKDGVKAVCDVGERRARAVLVKEGGEAEGEHLVAAIPAKDVFGRDALRRGDRLAQRAHLEGRIQLQGIEVVVQIRRHRAGRGRVRVLVGVEFDVAAVGRLFARRVRGDRARPAAE